MKTPKRLPRMKPRPPRSRKGRPLHTRKRHPWVWVVEAFGVLTGGSFVLSAAGNALIFWWVWKLNYFMIASPADVVMSSFVVFGFSVLAALALAAFTVLLLMGRGPLSQAMAPSYPDWPRTRPIGRIKIGAVAALVIGAMVLVVSGMRDSPSFSYRTGLMLAAESSVTPECAGARVVWLGGASAIIRCSEGIRVHHKLDDLVMRQVREAP